jgi:hypothetical protein
LDVPEGSPDHPTKLKSLAPAPAVQSTVPALPCDAGRQQGRGEGLQVLARAELNLWKCLKRERRSWRGRRGSNLPDHAATTGNGRHVFENTSRDSGVPATRRRRFLREVSMRFARAGVCPPISRGSKRSGAGAAI